MAGGAQGFLRLFSTFRGDRLRHLIGERRVLSIAGGGPVGFRNTVQAYLARVHRKLGIRSWTVLMALGWLILLASMVADAFLPNRQ
jgi:hypothetical protein